MEKLKNGTFEQTCLRKPHEWVVGRIVGANNNGKKEEKMEQWVMECWIPQYSNIPV